MSKYFHYSLQQLLMFGEIDFIIIKENYKKYEGNNLNSSIYGFTISVTYKENSIDKKIVSLIPPNNKCFTNGKYLVLSNINFNGDIKELIPYIKYNDYWCNCRLENQNLKEVKIINIDFTSKIEAYKYLLSLNDVIVNKYSTDNISILHNKILYMLYNKRFSHKLRDDLYGHLSYFKNHEKYQNYNHNIKLYMLNKIKDKISIDIIKGITYKGIIYKNIEEIFMDFNLIEESINEIDFNNL